MPDKPSTAAGYSVRELRLVHETCLYVATKLGDYMDDLVVVGGLVPSLLIPPVRLGLERICMSVPWIWMLAWPWRFWTKSATRS